MQPRARRQIGGDRRDQYVSGSRGIGDPAGDMDGKPGHRLAVEFDFAGMNGLRKLESHCLGGVAQRHRAARPPLPARRCAAGYVRHRSRRPVRRQQPRSPRPYCGTAPPARANRGRRAGQPAAPARRYARPEGPKACADWPAAAGRRSEIPQRYRRPGRRRRSRPGDRVRESRRAARRGYARRGNGWPADQPWRHPCGRSPASARARCWRMPRTSIAPFMRASATAAVGLADMRSNRAHHWLKCGSSTRPGAKCFKRRASAPHAPRRHR